MDANWDEAIAITTTGSNSDQSSSGSIISSHSSETTSIEGSASSIGIDQLVSIVELLREERATELEIKSRQREQNSRMSEYSDLKVQFCWIQHDLATEEDKEREAEMEDYLARLEDNIEVETAKIFELRLDLSSRRRDLNVALARLYKSGKDAILDTDKARLSPLFRRGLEKAKPAARLVRKYYIALRKARGWETLARSAIAEAIQLVRSDILRAEARQPGAWTALRSNMPKLKRAAKLCRWHILDRQQKEQLWLAQYRDQRSIESTLFHDTAAPILESAGLLARDRLRMSLVDESRHGEPIFFLDPPSDELTEAQKHDLVEEYTDAIRSTAKHDEVFRNLRIYYQADLDEYLRMHPNRSKETFDQEHLRYLRCATELLLQAEDREQKAKRRAEKADAIDGTYDFPRHSNDDKHKHPRTAAQLAEKAKRYPNASANSRAWLASLPPSVLSGFVDFDSPVTLPTSDELAARSVMLQDHDRASDTALERPEERMAKQKILIRYKAYCKDLRDSRTH